MTITSSLADPFGALVDFKIIPERWQEGRLFANSRVRNLTAWSQTVDRLDRVASL